CAEGKLVVDWRDGLEIGDERADVGIAQRVVLLWRHHEQRWAVRAHARADRPDPVLVRKSPTAPAFALGQIGRDEAADHCALEEQAARQILAVAVDAAADDS